MTIAQEYGELAAKLTGRAHKNLEGDLRGLDHAIFQELLKAYNRGVEDSRPSNKPTPPGPCGNELVEGIFCTLWKGHPREHGCAHGGAIVTWQEKS
jgi:hypothetical protein